MHPAFIAGGLTALLLGATAKSERDRVRDEGLARDVRRAIDDPSLKPDELESFARSLDELGEKSHAAALTAEARRRRGPAPAPAPTVRDAVAELVESWRQLGGSEIATLGLRPEQVKGVQTALGLEPHGEWDFLTALHAQAVHPDAPSSAGAIGAVPRDRMRAFFDELLEAR